VIWGYLFYHTDMMALWGTAIALVGVLVYFLVLYRSSPKPGTLKPES
jgi:hypothetical protein